MNRRNYLLEYIEAHGAEKSNITIMPVVWHDDLFAIEIRFPANTYKITDKQFLELRDYAYSSSGGGLVVATDSLDFRSGILGFKVAFKNHGFSSKKAMFFLRNLLEEKFQILK